MNKLRWGKLVWSDWSDDPALAMCSLAAQGLWMRLMCIAAQGTPYGHVTINGKGATAGDIARLVRIKTRRAEQLIAELERRGVAARDANSVLFCRRMVADWTLFVTRNKAAKARWNKETRPGLHMQNPDFAYTESIERESEEESLSLSKSLSPSKGERDLQERIRRVEEIAGRARAAVNGGKRDGSNGVDRETGGGGSTEIAGRSGEPDGDEPDLSQPAPRSRVH